MTKCRKCGHEVSDAAPRCPHCGAAHPGITVKDRLIGLGIFVVIATAAVGYFLSGSDETAPFSTPPSQSPPSSTKNTDAQEFADFHKALSAFERPMDEASRKFERASSDAIRRGDIYGFYDIAKSYHDLLSTMSDRLYSNEIKLPDLQNPEAKDDAAAAITALQSNLHVRMAAAQAGMDLVYAGDLKSHMASVIRDANTATHNEAMHETLAIAKGYADVGVDVRQINAQSGAAIATPRK